MNYMNYIIALAAAMIIALILAVPPAIGYKQGYYEGRADVISMDTTSETYCRLILKKEWSNE